MIERIRIQHWATLIFATLLLSGCTPESSNPKTYPVTGTVTKGGKPVSGASRVCFGRAEWSKRLRDDG